MARFDEVLDFHSGLFSDETIDLGKRFNYSSPNQIFQFLPMWQQIAGEAGDSRAFQRELYKRMTGREAPEQYGGFHARQADRITNVFNPDEVDIDAMQQIAFIATALREMQAAGLDELDRPGMGQMYFGGGAVQRAPALAPASAAQSVTGGGAGGGGGASGGRASAPVRQAAPPTNFNYGEQTLEDILGLASPGQDIYSRMAGVNQAPAPRQFTGADFEFHGGYGPGPTYGPLQQHQTRAAGRVPVSDAELMQLRDLLDRIGMQ